VITDNNNVLKETPSIQNRQLCNVEICIFTLQIWTNTTLKSNRLFPVQTPTLPTFNKTSFTTGWVILPTDKQNNRFTQWTYYLAHRGNYVSHVTQTLTGTGNAQQQPFHQQSGGGWWKKARPLADITTSVNLLLASYDRRRGPILVSALI